MMEKQNIDWANIGFGYMPIGERFVANYKDGKWDNGRQPTPQLLSANVQAFCSMLRLALRV